MRSKYVWNYKEFCNSRRSEREVGGGGKEGVTCLGGGGGWNTRGTDDGGILRRFPHVRPVMGHHTTSRYTYESFYSLLGFHSPPVHPAGLPFSLHHLFACPPRLRAPDLSAPLSPSFSSPRPSYRAQTPTPPPI